jgi:D-serine deaminase-like pyridoxal phosphate-dependent protein
VGSIRDEIRQTRPFASAADEAVVTLLGTADRVRTALSSVVEAHGITLQQYNVLRILPNHACVVANLHDRLVGVSGDRVEAVLEVTARGRVR